MTAFEARPAPETEVLAWPEDPPPDWVRFHLAHPVPGGVGPWDPNCAFFWKGRYHLFYILPAGEAGDAFAHVSSTDLVHWRWHPTTLTPATMGHGMWSGAGFLTKEGRPAIIYFGQTAGRNHISFAEDDSLETWSPPVAIDSRVRPEQDGSGIREWDPCAWLEGDTYYAVFGGLLGTPASLHRSDDLIHWEYVGPFLSTDLPEAAEDSDLSGPDFFELGGKRMLLCISHSHGCRYYLGEWSNERFTPESHGRMNWHGWDVFAVESVLTPDGRRVMWAWCPPQPLMDETGLIVLEAPTLDEARDEPVQRGIQSLPRELSLPEDGILRIRPLRELESLRFDEVRLDDLVVTDGVAVPLEGVSGDALELRATIRPGRAARAGVRVHCDPDGRDGLTIVADAVSRTLRIGEVCAPFELGVGEELVLRVFVDKQVVEVFANDRQAMLLSHPHDPSSAHVALVAEGADAGADVVAWRMASPY